MYKVAVAGATGNVGREMLSVLAERAFPTSEVVALASTRSTGTDVSFGDNLLRVKALEHYDFRGTDIVLMSAGSAVAKTWAPKAAAAGAIVIDNSSAWRMDREVPLIVPEVNADALNGGFKKGIIANPNCSTAQLVVALKPLNDAAKIKRVVVSTYQSVSGAGKEAMDELFRQTRAVFVADPIETEHFTKQIAYNVIPHIDDFLDSGLTKEEWKMMVETQKILDPDIQLTATCVRVPVFVGHSEAVNIEFENPITADKARQLLRAAPGILVVDKREDGGYATPVECAGEDATYVSRIRKDPTVEHGLSLWIVSDNLRKGAALNAVQIAECLINRKLLKKAA
ncbi:MAG: aspartate-semialdehyde dehydrogenase [Proteobacteria bacterium]|nr:aspartate-semialdehyde dehydrogenase [Pseudomonadota bacterium]